MSGTSGHSGGARKGAGRKPVSTKLRDGQVVNVRRPAMPMELYTVRIIRRGLMVLEPHGHDEPKMTIVTN